MVLVVVFVLYWFILTLADSIGCVKENKVHPHHTWLVFGHAGSCSPSRVYVPGPSQGLSLLQTKYYKL